MIYHLQDGDIIKLAPTITKDNKIKLIFEINTLYVGPARKTKQVFDYKNYISQIINIELKKGNNILSRKILNRFALIYHNNELKYTKLPLSIWKIIEKESNNNIFDVRSNLHINVKIKQVEMDGNKFNSYDDTCFLEKTWEKPVDEDSVDEWTNYIKNNTPFNMEEYIEKNNLISNIELLKSEFGTDHIGHIIAEARDKKLDLLIKD